MTLANDLHWLVREGYVIEFNDGALDLPRAKAQQPEKPAQPDQKPVESAPSVAPEAGGHESAERSVEPEPPAPEVAVEQPVVAEQRAPDTTVEQPVVAGIADPGPHGE
jgi:hypothetical protein